MILDSKEQRIEKAPRSVNSTYNSIPRMGSASKLTGVSSGSVGIDRILAGVGFPRNHFTEIWGGEHTGKTTLALTACGEVIEAGGNAVLIEIEGTTSDTGLALRVNPANKDIIRPVYTCGEEVFYTIEQLLLSGAVDLIVVDTLAVMYFKAEENAAPNDVDGFRANVITRALRYLNVALRNSNTAVVFVNQFCNKRIMGTDGKTLWSDDPASPHAAEHSMSVRIQMLVEDEIRQNNVVVGYKHKAVIGKNKLGILRHAAYFNMFSGRINQASELLREAMITGEVSQSYKKYSFGELKLGTVKEACEYLRGNPGTFKQLRAKVLQNKYEPSEAIDLVH